MAKQINESFIKHGGVKPETAVQRPNVTPGGRTPPAPCLTEPTPPPSMKSKNLSPLSGKEVKKEGYYICQVRAGFEKPPIWIVRIFSKKVGSENYLCYRTPRSTMDRVVNTCGHTFYGPLPIGY